MINNTLTSLRKDWSLSATLAGFLAVLISYAGPLVIFFQAAQAAQISSEMMVSWVWAISIGAGVSGIFLSIYLKTPVVTAWSAPGTALLVSLFPALSLSEMVAAYMTAASVLLLIGLSGYFDKLIALIPKGIAAGMMAGILFQFGVNTFKSVAAFPLLAASMLATYVLARRLLPRYAIVLVLIVGAVFAAWSDLLHLPPLNWEIAQPQWTSPTWSWQSTLSFALPLIVVSLTGQFLPGMAILQLSGYTTKAKPILIITSIASLLVAGFGGITIVIAAITAALCTGTDAHPSAKKRYIAGIANGVFYLIGGVLAGTIVALFSGLPKELVAILAGLALIGAITTNVIAMLEQEAHREASMLSFLATASGMTVFGLGSAFWGIVIGGIAYLILQKNPLRSGAPIPAPDSSLKDVSHDR